MYSAIINRYSDSGMVTRKDLVSAHSLDKCDSDDHSTHSHSPSLETEQKRTMNSITANADSRRDRSEKNYSDNCDLDDFIYTGVTLDKTYSENDLSLLSTELPSRSMSISSGHFNGDQASSNSIKLGLLLKKKKKRKKAEFLEHTIDLENEMAL